MRPAVAAVSAFLAVAPGALADTPAGSRGVPHVALQPVVTIAGETVTTLTHARDGSNRLFVVLRSGSIRIVQAGSLLPTPFLSALTPAVYTSGFEQGLLGLAFHPNYRANGRFFVYYNAQPDGRTVLARYTRSATDPNQADPASATVLLEAAQPNDNHNGGDIRFGPDGYLYVAKGDGGNGGNEARDLGSLLGKMLRIDVDNGSPYGIPPGNPFVGVPGARPEIWALGLRNPWRFSFDRATGDMFIGDVGQVSWEEVDFEPAGGPGGVDYGWNVMEGTSCYLQPTCNQAGLTLPILEYATPNNGSVIGGSRYRGPAFPGLQGVYFYGDFGSMQLFAAEPSGPGTWTGAPVLATGVLLTTLGEDEIGEIYAGGLQGSVHRIVQSGATPSLAIGDASRAEGDAGTPQAVFTLTLTPAATGQVTVAFATADGTALAGTDYLAASGTLTIPAGAATATLPVTILPDVLDENDEGFVVNLSNATGNVFLADSQGQGAIVDDDPTPTVSVTDAAVVEGNAGNVNVVFDVTLSAPSGRDVSVSAVTRAGTATPGVDFGDAFLQMAFAPGQTALPFPVEVWGDTLDEPDEHYRVELFDLVAAAPGHSVGQGLIRDDDGGARPVRELRHRSSLFTDLAAPSSALAREDLYLLSQQPYASYEVIVDGASGDLGPAGSGPRLELMSSDLADVLQSSVPAGLGFARSLRLENDEPTVNERWYVRVMSDACDTDCGPEDVYRVRAYDTTLAGARFNNAGTQVTVLILQNASRDAAAGHVSFWNANGALLASQPFALVPFASVAINTSSIGGLAGQSGSLTVAGSAAYGTLTGKTVALEPATGYSFDAPLVPRP